VLRAQQRFQEAIFQYETVLALNRNWVHAIAALGNCKFVTGAIEEAIPAQERAVRVSPRDPKIWFYYYWIGQAHPLQSRVDEAILWFERPASPIRNTRFPTPTSLPPAPLNGETERTTAELALARMLSGDDRYTSIARLRAVGPFRVPTIRALSEAATYFASLRKAGMANQ
jgi:tetratricopeptide (TPR) repeat protein